VWKRGTATAASGEAPLCTVREGSVCTVSGHRAAQLCVIAEGRLRVRVKGNGQGVLAALPSKAVPHGPCHSLN